LITRDTETHPRSKKFCIIFFMEKRSRSNLTCKSPIKMSLMSLGVNGDWNSSNTLLVLEKVPIYYDLISRPPSKCWREFILPSIRINAKLEALLMNIISKSFNSWWKGFWIRDQLTLWKKRSHNKKLGIISNIKTSSVHSFLVHKVGSYWQ
jgi:hypothetical protein